MAVGMSRTDPRFQILQAGPCMKTLQVDWLCSLKTRGYSPHRQVFATKFDWWNRPRPTSTSTYPSDSLSCLESYQMLTTLRLQWFPWPDPSECHVDLVSGCFFMSFAHKTTSRYFRPTIPDTAQATHATVCWRLSLLTPATRSNTQFAPCIHY